MTPNGQPLITAEDMQQGILDVLDDNGSLETVENIFKVYEDYQTQITALKNQIAAQEQQAELNAIQGSSQELEKQMQQGMKDMTFRNNNSNVNNQLNNIGL